MMHEFSDQLHSRHLGESRTIHVICGDHFRPGTHRFAVLCIDGQLLGNLVRAVPSRISTCCMFAGIASNASTRDYDLIRGYFPDRYNAHQRFVVDEVTAYLSRRYGIDDSTCVNGVCGFSNGATFAHSLASQGVFFRFAIVFSAADNRVRPNEYSTPHHVRYYLAAGTREPDYLSVTKSIADDLCAAGVEHTFLQREAGHNMEFWSDEFPRAMDWVVEAHR